jgi:hypothetical protein
LSDRLIFGLVNAFAYLRHPVNIARFRLAVGYFPNVARPRRYNEKMLWRKFFDHNPLFVSFSDKLATKAIQAERCPGLQVLPALWIGTDVSTIPDDLLGRPIAVKASHGCGYNFFSMPGATPRPLPAEKINGWLKKSYGRGRLEWAYRLVDRKIFVEELIVAAEGRPPTDISVHAANATALFIEVVVGNKTGDQQKGYFRPDGSRWPDIERKPTAGRQALPPDFQLPATYIEALLHAERLSQGVDYARFDFLAVAERLYGGEITVYPGSGLTRQADFSNYNRHLTRHWDLSQSWFITSRHKRPRRLYAEALRRYLTVA